MYLNFFGNGLRQFEEWLEPMFDFFTRNYQNPFMWLGFFFLGITVFHVTYRALEKER